jgi:hypothetical protein
LNTRSTKTEILGVESDSLLSEVRECAFSALHNDLFSALRSHLFQSITAVLCRFGQQNGPLPNEPG